ncbi:MAG: (Fe-S)-binding protein [Bacteroidetes bacterium]|nr:(Fe-S)-binding protein [Bacteroidota bacterium]
MRAMSPLEEALRRCIHCGMCLPSCPTYEISQREEHSPRGRIQLFRSFWEGELELSPLIAESFAYCLGCYACKTACPAGVRYEYIFEAARDELEARYPNRLKRLLLRALFAHLSLLRLLALTLRWTEQIGLRRWALQSGWFARLFPRLARLEPFAPPISRRFSRSLIRPLERPASPPRARVRFLLGCVMDVAFAETNRSSVDLLLASGAEVHTPLNQGCCGALHAHNGDLRTARRLAQRLIAALGGPDAEAVITNSAGCGAFMKSYGALLADDPQWATQARTFSDRVRDLSEWLLEAGLPVPLRALPVRATYHDACHHVHAQGIARQPRTLLGRIPELELVPLEESSWCCGSAGIYSLLRPQDAAQLLERKLERLRRTGAQWVITGNPGCVLQLRAGIQEAGLNMAVHHYADVLRWALPEA